MKILHSWEARGNTVLVFISYCLQTQALKFGYLLMLTSNRPIYFSVLLVDFVKFEIYFDIVPLGLTPR